MKHKLISVTNIDNLIENIDETIENEFTPTLAFIYASVHCDIPFLFTRLKKYDFYIVGSSTVGEIYGTEEDGVYVKDFSIACMLVDINPSNFKLKVKKIEGDDFYSFGESLATWSESKFRNPALLTITAGLHFDNESYIEGLQTKVTHLFGGAAGDDNIFKNTYVFSREKLITSGVLVLAFNQDNIEIINTRGFGWSGIGTQRVVTKSVNNVVFTIDDKPAIKFYQDYLNITMDDMPEMGANHPLEVVLNNGQVVYRTPILIEEDGSLIFAGHVKEGSKVRISAPIGEGIIDEVEESITKALHHREDFKADLTLIFPCAAHKNLLGTYGIKEIEAVYHATQNIPLIGFYAYGEISSSTKSNAFHNETFVTVQLKERI
jgi:hypothetical protein